MTDSRSRWLFVTSLAVAMALSVAACGGSDSSSSSGSAPEEDATTADTGNCKPAHEFTTIDEGTLKVASIEYLPYSSVDGSSPTGVDGEILQEFAKMECLDTDATLVEAAGAIAQVSSGRADVATGDWWRTNERKGEVDVSEPTYLDAMAVVSKDGYKTFDELEGKQVGDLQGDIWNKEAQEVLGGDYHLYPSNTEALQDLEAGRLDAVIATAGSMKYEQQQGKYTDYKVEVMEPDSRVVFTSKEPQSGIPYAKGNTALGEALSDDIEAMRKDGTLAKILGKYGIPASVLETGAPYFV